jgi:hypothetical protein
VADYPGATYSPFTSAELASQNLGGGAFIDHSDLDEQLGDEIEAIEADLRAAIADGGAATTIQQRLQEIDTEVATKADTSAAVMDGDAAGGVLSGTYPSPGFAVDMATQAELNTAIANAVNDGDTAGGDLGGTYPNPTVIALQGVTVDNSAPGDGDALVFNGLGYVPTDVATQAEFDAHTGATTSVHGIDDTSQLALLPGRASGQTLIGGTGAGDDLTLRSTAHATKGIIVIGDDGSDVSVNGTEVGITIAATPYETRLVIHDEGGALAEHLGVHKHSDTAGLAAHVVLARSRGTEGAETAVQDDDAVGRISFVGHDGTDYGYAGWISCLIDDTPGAGDMPGRLVFATSANGAEVPTIRMTIDSAGNLIGAGGTLSGFTLADLVTHEAAADPHPGYVLKSLFDANTILTANTDNTPLALSVAEQRIIGRITGGNIAALTSAQTKTMLAYIASEITATPSAEGETTGTDVQAQLDELALRTASLAGLTSKGPAFEIWEDFLNPSNVTGQVGRQGMAATSAGTAPFPHQRISAVTDASPGVFAHSVVDPGDGSTIHLGATMLAGAPVFTMAMRVQWPDLIAGGSHEWTNRFGLHDNVASANNNAPTDGIFWLYDQTDTSLHCVCSGGGTATNQDSGFVIAADTWYWLVITCDTLNVRFFHGTTLAAVLAASADTTITGGNIPTSSEAYGIAFQMWRTLGSGERQAWIDCFYYRQELATPR